jgi:hypothetical protein
MSTRLTHEEPSYWLQTRKRITLSPLGSMQKAGTFQGRASGGSFHASMFEVCQFELIMDIRK